MHERPWCFRCDVMRQEAETLRAEVARLKQLLSPHPDDSVPAMLPGDDRVQAVVFGRLLSPMPQEGPSFDFSHAFGEMVGACKGAGIPRAPAAVYEADAHEPAVGDVVDFGWSVDANGSPVDGGG